MQLPVAPPDIDELLKTTLAADPSLVVRLFAVSAEVDDQGRYLHWDKLRHLPPPEGMTPEQWWLGLKVARRAHFRPLPLRDKAGKTCVSWLPG